MAVRIDQVLDYLDSHPICFSADGVESLLQMLYIVYSKHNTFDSGTLVKLEEDLASKLFLLSEKDRTQFFSEIEELCMEHEQLAFIHGFIVGLHLMTKIRTVS